MKTCELCQSEFPNWIKIDGKNKNLKNRKYCLECSPWGKHNTVKLDAPKSQWKPKPKPKGGTYKYQKKRGVKRKADLVLLKGGKCETCGYNKNLGALEFHHKDPSQKVSKIDVRIITNRTWDFLLTELDKCLLLCANCHREHHCPDLNYWAR